MIKYLLVFTGLLLGLSSCSTDDALSTLSEAEVYEEKTELSQDNELPEELVIAHSEALRTTLEKVSNFQVNLADVAIEEQKMNPLCFQFIYPITVAYSDNSVKEIMNYEELLQALLDETNSLYLNGVAFPFKVEDYYDNSTKTITNEEEFKTLIAGCGYDNIDYTYVINATSPCFTVNYPLDFIIKGTTKTFYSQEEAYDYFNTYWASPASVDISYPFRVTLTKDGKKISIENDFEIIHLIKDICNME